MSYIIHASDLTKSLHGRTLFQDLNLGIHEGEILGIAGKSGAGKTTLLRTLMGLYKADGGKVLYNLKKPAPVAALRNEPKFERLLGYSAQEGSFYENLTVKENLLFYAQFYFDEVPLKYIRSLLEEVDLYEHKDTISKRLSAGMQKKLDILCAMVHKPRFLFLDEPTAHLDVDSRRQILHLIRSINEIGTTVVVTSHLLDELQGLCHRVVLLDQTK